jgi:peptidylprolyl isomerase
MKHSVLILFLAACATAAIAQTSAKPAAPAAAASHPAATSSAVKLPPGVPPGRGIVKTAFSLRYQDIKVGTGADAEPNKMYKVHYTGYLGADGHKFDSSYDHPRQPVMGKDGKPELDADGKPKQGDPQPMSFPQGMGRLIPGFDQGFYGMKVGGKRRLFIPWQLAYGAKGRPGPDAAHPGIPPKADLIFDVELMDVVDMPTPPTRPGMGGMPGGRPMPPGGAPHPGAPGAPGAPITTPGAPATPGAAPSTPAPTAPVTSPAVPGSTTPPPQAAPTAPAQTPPPATPPAAPSTTTPPAPQSH